MPTAYGTITGAEKANGFTQETLNAYLAERDSMVGIGVRRGKTTVVQAYVPGNVVTEFVRSQPAIRHESAMKGWNPFKRQWG